MIPSVVLDCDPGIDDALAIALLARQHRSGHLNLEAISVVGGNVGLERTAANAAFLVERFELDVPVFGGAAAPLAGPAPGDAAHVHGGDGLGGVREPGAPAPPMCDVGELHRALQRRAAGERVLVATGPLTNVAALIDHDPDFASQFDRVIAMGGAFGDPSGNATEHAEFNIWIDPHSAAIVFAAGVPVRLVPLDVTKKVALTEAHVGEFEAAGAGPTLVSQILTAGLSLGEQVSGNPRCEMHDPLAAAAVLSPELMRWTRVAVAVDIEGPFRGRTRRCDERTDQGVDDSVEVALGVDATSATDHLAAHLSEVRDR